MRIAIPAEDNRGLDSNVCPHFGRARFFVLVDVEGGKLVNVDVVSMPFERHMPGDIPNFLRNKGVELVIAYGVGRRAMEFFENLGIKVITGASGRVGDVVEGYLRDKLNLDEEWQVRDEFKKHR